MPKIRTKNAKTLPKKKKRKKSMMCSWMCRLFECILKRNYFRTLQYIDSKVIATFKVV